MVYRKRQPNQFRWNGIGGKLEPNESPLDGVAREVREETGIDINRAALVDYAGIVSWPDAPRRGNKAGGMHAFIARFDDASVRWEGPHLSDEGDLAWHPLDWVCDRSNPSVVDNISHFLPEMLISTKPKLYRCVYEDGEFARVEIASLNSALSRD
jgi:8-oxo-dGTP diphosphatase